MREDDKKKIENNDYRGGEGKDGSWTKKGRRKRRLIPEKKEIVLSG